MRWLSAANSFEFARKRIPAIDDFNPNGLGQH
jgi:hypothetical protein